MLHHAVAVALALASAERIEKPKPIEPSYAEAYQRAITWNKPLIVWVGQRPKDVKGCISIYQTHFAGIDQPEKGWCVISRPRADYLEWVKTIQGTPTDTEILEALRPPMALPAPRCET